MTLVVRCTSYSSMMISATAACGSDSSSTFSACSSLLIANTKPSSLNFESARAFASASAVNAVDTTFNFRNLVVAIGFVDEPDATDCDGDAEFRSTCFDSTCSGDF